MRMAMMVVVVMMATRLDNMMLVVVMKISAIVKTQQKTKIKFLNVTFSRSFTLPALPATLARGK